MFKFATVVVLVLLGIGLWFVLSGLFSIVGAFFEKWSGNFVDHETNEKPARAATGKEMGEDVPDEEKGK